MTDWDIAVGETLLRRELHDRWGRGTLRRHGTLGEGQQRLCSRARQPWATNSATATTDGMRSGRSPYTGDGQEGTTAVLVGGNHVRVQRAALGLGAGRPVARQWVRRADAQRPGRPRAIPAATRNASCGGDWNHALEGPPARVHTTRSRPNRRDSELTWPATPRRDTSRGACTPSTPLSRSQSRTPRPPRSTSRAGRRPKTERSRPVRRPGQGLVAAEGPASVDRRPPR